MQIGRIGELLIKKKLLSQEQLNMALEFQRLNPTQPIGQILCQMGFLKAQDLEFVLNHNNKRRKLGEILISQNLINEERLSGALKISKDENIPLGRALIRQHLLEEEQLARAIASQHDLKYVNLAEIRLDPGLSRYITATYAQRLRIVPIQCRDNTLTVAMAYPIQREERFQLESWCNILIYPVIAKESDIVIAQQKLYKLNNSTTSEEIEFELSEDPIRDSGKSKYTSDIISADVDFLVKRLISTGIMRGASDIHLESTDHGMIARFRLDGILQMIDIGVNDAMISTPARQIVSKIKIMSDMDISERRRPQDSSFKMNVSKGGKVRSVDFRISTIPTQFGENVTIRILDKHSGNLNLQNMRYSPEEIAALYTALDKPTGIFLVTGPTGSGKSSTLYAMLSHINTPGVKTLSIEDPIEYSIEGITQTEVNESIGNTFACLLRAFLRQDPDNIMVGEIRDLETATISMRAALTGHTVLSTLHTNDATSAVTRLIDMGVEPNLISSTLRGVLAQRLVRQICGECRISYTPSALLLSEFAIHAGSGIEFIQGKGCPHCNYTGFSGRRPIVELWIPTRDELMIINRRPDNLTLRKTVFSDPDRVTMIKSGLKLVQAGETTLEELLRVVPYELIEVERSSFADMQ